MFERCSNIFGVYCFPSSKFMYWVEKTCDHVTVEDHQRRARTCGPGPMLQLVLGSHATTLWLPNMCFLWLFETHSESWLTFGLGAPRRQVDRRRLQVLADQNACELAIVREFRKVPGCSNWFFWWFFLGTCWPSWATIGISWNCWDVCTCWWSGDVDKYIRRSISCLDRFTTRAELKSRWLWRSQSHGLSSAGFLLWHNSTVWDLKCILYVCVLYFVAKKCALISSKPPREAIQVCSCPSKNTHRILTGQHGEYLQILLRKDPSTLCSLVKKRWEKGTWKGSLQGFFPQD